MNEKPIEANQMKEGRAEASPYINCRSALTEREAGRIDSENGMKDSPIGERSTWNE
jgi:hypothetical protein